MSSQQSTSRSSTRPGSNSLAARYTPTVSLASGSSRQSSSNAGRSSTSRASSSGRGLEVGFPRSSARYTPSSTGTASSGTTLRAPDSYYVRSSHAPSSSSRYSSSRAPPTSYRAPARAPSYYSDVISRTPHSDHSRARSGTTGDRLEARFAQSRAPSAISLGSRPSASSHSSRAPARSHLSSPGHSGGSTVYPGSSISSRSHGGSSQRPSGGRGDGYSSSSRPRDGGWDWERITTQTLRVKGGKK